MFARTAFFLLAALTIHCTAMAQSRGPRPQLQLGGGPEAGAHNTAAKQLIEVRTYSLVDEAAEAKLDAYLGQALIPALIRQGLGPIGALDQAEIAADGAIEVVLLIPGPSLEAVTGATAKLADDQEYLQAAADYLNTPAKAPVVKRIRSELLTAFDCWPQVTVPQQRVLGKPRYFEMRTYESATERLGELKVEMFNAGEVPIFLDCSIAPVFMGQALVGDMMPNLTYMTVFDDKASRDASWDKFRQHPDWNLLKVVPKYQDTVSRNRMSFWVPKSYSQL